MRHRVWSAVCKAARWYALSFGAALCTLGNAEFAYLQHAENAQDVEAYARAGVAELEAWLGRFAVND